jgi:hypothetical protein
MSVLQFGPRLKNSDEPQYARLSPGNDRTFWEAGGLPWTVVRHVTPRTESWKLERQNLIGKTEKMIITDASKLTFLNKYDVEEMNGPRGYPFLHYKGQYTELPPKDFQTFADNLFRTSSYYWYTKVCDLENNIPYNVKEAYSLIDYMKSHTSPDMEKWYNIRIIDIIHIIDLLKEQEERKKIQMERDELAEKIRELEEQLETLSKA